MKNFTKTLLGALAGLVLSFGGGGAWADVVYTFSHPNSDLSGFPGPFGSLTVHLVDSTHATLTYAGDSVGQYTYLMIDSGEMDANVNATSFSVSTPTTTALNGNFSAASYSGGGAGINIGSFNVDDQGTFNLKIDAGDGYDHAINTGTFTITNNSGTWASAGNVLTTTGNGDGNFAAAHFAVCDTNLGTCSPAINASATGFVGTVPIPAAAWLFGSGLVGLIAIARRRIKGNDSPAFA